MLDLTKLASSFSYVFPVSKLSVLLNLLPCSTPVVALLLLNELEYGLSEIENEAIINGPFL